MPPRRRTRRPPTSPMIYWWPHLQHTVATQGLTESFTYDCERQPAHRQAGPTRPRRRTRANWTYTYNGTGQLLTAQSPRSDLTAITTYGYTGGTLTSITDALRPCDRRSSTATGGGLPEEDHRIRTALLTDARLQCPQLADVKRAGDLRRKPDHQLRPMTAPGTSPATTLPDSSYLAYGYDDAHRPTSITNALSESAAITYDSAGDITQTLWKNASGVTKRQHTATYDALGAEADRCRRRKARRRVSATITTATSSASPTP